MDKPKIDPRFTVEGLEASLAWHVDQHGDEDGWTYWLGFLGGTMQGQAESIALLSNELAATKAELIFMRRPPRVITVEGKDVLLKNKDYGIITVGTSKP